MSTPACSAATIIMQKIGTAGPLMVIDVVTSPRSMPWKSRSGVGGRVDGHAAVAYLAERALVVGVASHHGRHVEGHAEAAATTAEDHPVALVGLLGAAEAGELADRPRTAAVTGGAWPRYPNSPGHSDSSVP